MYNNNYDIYFTNLLWQIIVIYGTLLTADLFLLALYKGQKDSYLYKVHISLTIGILIVHSYFYVVWAEQAQFVNPLSFKALIYYGQLCIYYIILWCIILWITKNKQIYDWRKSYIIIIIILIFIKWSLRINISFNFFTGTYIICWAIIYIFYYHGQWLFDAHIYIKFIYYIRCYFGITFQNLKYPSVKKNTFGVAGYKSSKEEHSLILNTFNPKYARQILNKSKTQYFAINPLRKLIIIYRDIKSYYKGNWAYININLKTELAQVCCISPAEVLINDYIPLKNLIFKIGKNHLDILGLNMINFMYLGQKCTLIDFKKMGILYFTIYIDDTPVYFIDLSDENDPFKITVLIDLFK